MYVPPYPFYHPNNTIKGHWNLKNSPNAVP